MYKKITLILLVLLLSTLLINAQGIQPDPDEDLDPNANISWPPPVYVLSGEIDLIGSANLTDMTGYFIEFRPLQTGSTAQASPWFPVTLLFTTPVVDDVLGTWNTETVEDGLYDLRLVVNVRNQPPNYFVVSPLRIQNEPPFGMAAPSGQVTPTPLAVARPTLLPTPTGLSSEPIVTANLDANVRSGDSTSYPRIGSLFRGDSARVIGRSSRGNGWYYIQLSNGNFGWIAPSVVSASGDFSNVIWRDPPATSTPTPTNTPVPQGNLAAATPARVPGTPTCQVSFQVRVHIENNGTATTAASATVLIQDIRTATGEVLKQAWGAVPVLAPGGGYVVTADFTESRYYNEQHTTRVIIDPENFLTETNEADNTVESYYVLQQGACP
jgi:uncharacterized protein YraI